MVKTTELMLYVFYHHLKKKKKGASEWIIYPPITERRNGEEGPAEKGRERETLGEATAFL